MTHDEKAELWGKFRERKMNKMPWSHLKRRANLKLWNFYIVDMIIIFREEMDELYDYEQAGDGE